MFNCKELVFHFNKKSLEDPLIPAWVIKCKGETHYVKSVTANAPWSTKETPENAHTKGSIKLKHVSVTITEDQEAIIQTISAKT